MRGVKPERLTFVHLAGVPLGDPRWACTAVLIHGIDGDAVATWGNDTSEKAWYRELANAVPGLSIISFEIDYSISEKNTETLIEDYSYALVNTIIENRLFHKACFFIAHSLGGILLKRAISDFSHFDQNNYLWNCRINIRGTFFLAVPHRGSLFASPLIRALRWRSSRAWADLSPGSRALPDLSRMFEGDVHRYPNMRLVSFHETLPVRIKEIDWLPKTVRRWFGDISVPWTVVPAERSTLNIKGERSIKLHATHYSISSFTHSDREIAMAEITDALTRFAYREDRELTLSDLLSSPDGRAGMFTAEEDGFF